ncbi:MAG: hypothetical protein KUG77_08250 [Nannocystaceae bacterium]|nr:hypothetical protein [Nannocystaceae bacterium]
MRTTTFRLSLLALVSSLSLGCELELVAEYLPAAEENIHPAYRVAAVSDNHEFLFIASATTGELKMMGTNGTEVDEFALSSTWRPVAAATYYGPDFDAFGIGQANEAGLVLHANGSILPWFHHGGQLRYHWDGVIAVPASPAGGTRTVVDVDQSKDGVLFVLTEESPAAGGPQSRLWRRETDGTWTSVVGASKVSAMAYDQHTEDVTVALTRTSARDVTLVEYDDDLSYRRSRTVPDLRAVTDFEVLAATFYMGVHTCGNAQCTSGDPELQIRDLNLALDDSDAVRAEAIALDLPPFPIDADSNIELWRAGADVMQVGHYDVITD